jgi:hypothetical protein
MSNPQAPSSTRRAFLRLAAIAPLAAAGCATLGAGPAASPAAVPSSSSSTDPLAVLRAMPLPTSVEPALIFRALGGRGRCG